MTAVQIPWDRNVSELPARAPRAVHSPSSMAEVVDLIRSHAPGAPRLRSVSTGRNWGLGSATTDDPDTAVIDLSLMDGIRAVDEELGYAVVEPGVTQAALASALEGKDWVLNCTNSSAHTSVLGNAMDRGIGARRSRVEELLGLELVLADGTVGTVGWWPGARGSAPNRHGLGPSLIHLFTQANLAVATAGVVRLDPRPEASDVVTATIDEPRLGELVSALRGIVRQGLTSGIVKLYDAETEGGAVVATSICVEGAATVVAARRDEVADRLRAAGATIADRDDAAVGLTSSTILSLFRGELTQNERLLRLATGVSAPEVDSIGRGWIFSVPIVPLTVEDVGRGRAIVADVASRTGLTLKATGNVLSHDAVDLVISIGFDRETQTDLAHGALRSLTEGFAAAGYVPYRIDTTRRRSDFFGSEDVEARLIARLREAIDPQGVFVPSRYMR